ncbi:response regulator [Dyadobacter fanqingshengii]|uniref:Response regulator n=1 Tax=Dyadobacter fanqingshengii TaxID=2906443 RepID=A0A9X1P931_9BACT|nr:response regulator [Dyadobacter fanqingshengii]MCF0040285.1 response regulator [Dyadobacter fanqingshengii]MCF2502228.1 response regulator [Dyadobacter fanqingshengii]USJ37967.1 response regulator [Dyadobacter fanqingshengii]
MKPLLHFFLIDDSAFDLFIYEKLLIKSGITDSVKTFNSARDALKHLVSQADTLPESIILLDLQMPDMNGFEFIDEFDHLPLMLQEKIRIFMLSSTIDTRDIDKAKASQHIIDLLPKPLEIATLKKKLGI